MKSILLIGGTGFIGSTLSKYLNSLGHKVLVWKHRESPIDPHNDSFLQALQQCDVVINLAGSPIITRWSARNRKKVMDSRVDVTNRIVEAIRRCPESKRPSQLINGSAIGYFNRVVHPITSVKDTHGDGFLSEVCVAWEAAALGAKTLGIQVSIVRIGVVLAKHGGALRQLVPLFKLGLGGHVGNGEQGFSWIHIQDLCRLIAYEMTLNESRIVHGHVPEHTDYRQFCQELGSALRRPSWLHAPGCALRLLLGEAADILLCTPTFRLDPAPGFTFEYPKLRAALRAILL